VDAGQLFNFFGMARRLLDDVSVRAWINVDRHCKICRHQARLGHVHICEGSIGPVASGFLIC